MVAEISIWLQKIKQMVHEIEPNAEVILYGSYARGNFKADSDIDLLILVGDEKLNYKIKKQITSVIYNIELDSGKIITPFIYGRNEWNKYQVTPFFKNVKEDAVFI